MDIDTVILTHGHADHIGGSTDDRGRPAFPRARYVMRADEWALWTAPAGLARLAAKGLAVGPARTNLRPLRDQLELIDHDGEIVPGVHALAAPGHTPGHMALTIASGRAQLLVSADTVIHPLHLAHPAWRWSCDLQPAQAARTVRRLFDRAAAEHMLVLAGHFPFPGLGHVIAGAEGWRWHPVPDVGAGQDPPLPTDTARGHDE